MSYLFIAVIGAIVGFIAGQYLKGSEQGPGIDIAAGTAGACVAVVLSRLPGTALAAGFIVSAIVSIGGAVLALYGLRRYMKAQVVPVPRSRKRY